MGAHLIGGTFDKLNFKVGEKGGGEKRGKKKILV